jgi:hypothetical protein
MKTSLAGILLIGIATLAQAALPLQKSPSELRDAILKVTPLGVSFSEAGSLIRGLKPKTFYTFDSCPDLPKIGVVGKAGVFVSKKWPLGLQPKGKAIISLLGEIDKFPPFIGVTYTSVGAWWGFDQDDRLIDVFIDKHAAGL